MLGDRHEPDEGPARLGFGALTDTGTLAFTAAYDPSGPGDATTGASSPFWTQDPYGFKAGDRISSEQNNLVKFGQRWYLSVLGSWTQQDTLDAPLDPANANRYAYVGGDPINEIDPGGLASVGDYAESCVADGLEGALVGTLSDGVDLGSGTIIGGALGCVGDLFRTGLESSGLGSYADDIGIAEAADTALELGIAAV